MNTLTNRIKARALELGFDPVGIAPAIQPGGVSQFREWLERGYAGEMHYMRRHATAREHPRHVLDGVRSIIVTAMNYRTHDPDPPTRIEGRVSRYAWGRDYHELIRGRLKELLQFIQSESPDVRGRAVVDTAPLLERDFARIAGLGWLGKNTMLISKRRGSWLFLGAVLIDLELEYDEPHHADHCGTCRRCLDACPTQAFVGPHQLDSRRCISYLTIELRGPVPIELRAGVGDWLFGCDVCQDVCPWNRKAPASVEPAFQPTAGMTNWNLIELLKLPDEELRELIRGTAMERAGVAGLRRNAAIVLGNARDPRALPVLEQRSEDNNEAVRAASHWAAERLR